MQKSPKPSLYNIFQHPRGSVVTTTLQLRPAWVHLPREQLKKMLALRQVWSSAGGRNSTTDLGGSAQARPDRSHRGHRVVNDVVGAAVDPLAFLQHRFLFWRARRSKAKRSGVWSQVRGFHAAMLPLSDILNKFLFTFWIMPLPFVDETVTNWQIRLECCCLFLWPVKDSKAVELEALLVAFYWPKVQREPGSLDLVNTSRTALSQRDRKASQCPST